MTVLDDNSLATRQVHTFRVDDVTVISVQGDFDVTAARLMRHQLDDLRPDDHVIVDCVDVDFIDGSGLDVLCRLAQRNVAAGGPLHVLASAAVRNTVALSGLEGLIALE
jgi:anti-anti-sigma factor